MRSTRGHKLSAALCATVLLVAATVGAELAVFVDGRVLKVEDAYLEDDHIVLILPGSGRIEVPAVRIDRVVADEVEAVRDEEAKEIACDTAWADEALPDDTPFSDLIHIAAEEANLHPMLLASLVRAESGFDPTAVSRAGAAGLTQLMPAAAQDQGVRDVFDPEDNLTAGARHLRDLVDRFDSITLALAAYNAGATTVKRYQGVPPYRETRAYVARVLGWFCPEPD